MLTFARPIRLNDLRVYDSKLLRNVDCLFLLSIGAASNSQAGRNVWEEEEEE